MRPLMPPLHADAVDPAEPAGGAAGAHGDAGLAAALRQAVLALDFGNTPDAKRGGAPLAHFPSIDLAVVQFDAGGRSRAANVLFSREHPQGFVAPVAPDRAAHRALRFDADLQGPGGESIAWAPDADWAALPWAPLPGQPGRDSGLPRFVAPYPASLLKLMLAVGLGLAIDDGALPGWPGAALPMVADSDNDATDEVVRVLHRAGTMTGLGARFAAAGLPTLQLHGTTPQGGWRNRDGAGVGRIHMTAWDTLRLLWLLDEGAPPPPWLPAGTPPLLQPATARHLLGLLAAQRHDHILSSGSLRGLPGWAPGLPDAPAFAHKTGFTESYASDAGILRAGGVFALVAVLTSLGSRYAEPQAPTSPPGMPAAARPVTTARLPALGARLWALLQAPPR